MNIQLRFYSDSIRFKLSPMETVIGRIIYHFVYFSYKLSTFVNILGEHFKINCMY